LRYLPYGIDDRIVDRRGFGEEAGDGGGKGCDHGLVSVHPDHGHDGVRHPRQAEESNDDEHRLGRVELHLAPLLLPACKEGEKGCCRKWL
jgi:hypothetical protein